MQKTYDDCYLICSTAVYFESQNNEAEALRSWRNALDQIYYHNAYRVSSNYRPRTETEKALQESLHQLELQCKERVDLLEALKQSRDDAAKDAAEGKDTSSKESTSSAEGRGKGVAKNDESPGKTGWLGGGTIPPIKYPDLSRPPLPKRPVIAPRKASGSSIIEAARAYSYPRANESSTSVNLAVTESQTDQRHSRTPSPEKRGKMLRTLRPGRDGSRPAPRIPSSMRTRPPAAAKAATQAWGIPTQGASQSSTLSVDAARDSLSTSYAPRASSARSSLEKSRSAESSAANNTRRPSSGTYNGGPESGWTANTIKSKHDDPTGQLKSSSDSRDSSHRSLQAKIPPTYTQTSKGSSSSRQPVVSNTSKPIQKNAQPLAYRKEYLPPTLKQEQIAQKAAAQDSAAAKANTSMPSPQGKPRRKAVPILGSQGGQATPSDSSLGNGEPSKRLHKLSSDQQQRRNPSISSDDDDDDDTEEEGGTESAKWKAESERILNNLPKGTDEAAARQILNEIVIKGDEVHWDDVAGLTIAKDALKETVVYPFLRPDLFMGLREPARGMLLFGPPGTGKTMLARAVATESRSTFFAISASSLTSKFLGESEKLVRALFALAKAMAPSIIFVDEIDSLLSARSGTGEHEATRRIKTEFLIQWSDLARAAAGREQSDKDRERGDASRVLVLAATNLPWDIDEAARRRFVRRQYIPLPEGHVRKAQLETLLGHQKHGLTAANLDELVSLTDGFSGSDITALAKDAAMGPLRSLGEKLLHMTMDEIRPIAIQDFRASLSTIRPSVSREGLKQFEEWAKEFGERGG